jgi:hypothetical protein
MRNRLVAVLRSSLPSVLGLAIAVGAMGCSEASSSEDSTGGAQAQTDAREGTPISAVSTLSVDASGKLGFSYTVGGGCAEHTPTAKVTVATGESSGTIKISDVTSAPDFCEALLHPKGTADLGALVSEARSDLAGRRITLSLPQVALEASGSPSTTPVVPGAVRHEVSDLGTVSVDQDGKLTFGYTTGGGCSQHTGVASVELTETPEGRVAKVKIFDESPAEDFCEALVPVEGTADLQTLIADAAKAAGTNVSGRRLTVELPNISFTAQ